MSRSLFRETSLERLSTPEQLDQVMRVTSPTAWIAILAMVTVVAGGLAWSILGSVPVKVSGRGILLSPGGVLDVIASSSGRVSAFEVQPGDRITVGQVVARVAQPDLIGELEAARSALVEETDHYRQVREFHQRTTANQHGINTKKRSAITQKLGFLEDRLRWLKEREGYEAELQGKGLIDRKRVIDTKIDINRAKEEVATAQNELKQIEIEETTTAITNEREILDLELKISTLKRTVQGQEDKLQRNITIESPYAGRIVEFKVNAGEVIEPGRALFTVLPQETDAGDPDAEEASGLVARLYVRPEDGKKIQAGMEAQVAPSTVKREEYGFIVGTVRGVAAVPSSEEGMLRVLKNKALVQELSDGGAPFEVTVALKRNPKAPSGFPLVVLPGTDNRHHEWHTVRGHLDRARNPADQFADSGAGTAFQRFCRNASALRRDSVTGGDSWRRRKAKGALKKPDGSARRPFCKWRPWNAGRRVLAWCSPDSVGMCRLRNCAMRAGCLATAPRLPTWSRPPAGMASRPRASPWSRRGCAP
ncbi:MAG: Membrane-fusion protein [Rhodospirillaceae bacterium]|nr:MAG: Membrane-fusion protein [Rhodospirillaceae bacterium]